MSNLTLRILRRMEWGDLYEKLVLNKELENIEKVRLLKVAVLLLNTDEKYLENFGYNIILLYSLNTEDYKPLYDISINLGFMPISKVLEGKFESKDSIWREINESVIESFKENDVVYTYGQMRLRKTFVEDFNEKDQIVVAPTSYGKSELMIEAMSSGGNVCVIVPTKALLSQTRKRIIDNSSDNSLKIISHHEMYSGSEDRVVAVLTQERLLKLYQVHPSLSFDIVLVDEAHNMLGDDSRNRFLAVSLMISKTRNPDILIHFFTPFLVEDKSLNTKYKDVGGELNKINEKIKFEKIFYVDKRKDGRVYLYNQFLDTEYLVEDISAVSIIDYLKSKSLVKNIIYFNRPVNIERFVNDFILNLDDIDDPDVDAAIDSIKSFIHKDYTLLDCLKKGVVFHHGSVPDNIKVFLEHLYRSIGSIKYIVTTSTLLEGVNIPAERLFLLSNKKGLGKLTRSQFQNLLGRVGRFSEIFDKENSNLNLLVPEVYMLASSEYGVSTENIKTFISDCAKVDKKEKDDVENIFLEESKGFSNDDLENASDLLNNLDPSILNASEIREAETEFGKSCYKNNIHELDILGCETQSQAIIDKITTEISSIDELLDVIYKAFIPFIVDSRENANVLRLRRENGVREFYSMLLSWRYEGVSFNEMVNRFVGYWERKLNEGKAFFYVGKWGEIKRGSVFFHWVDLRGKSLKQKSNLAIVRVKEERDFLEFTFMNYLEVLYDLEKIDEEFFYKIKYGTSEESHIVMLRNGLSYSLSKLIFEKYITEVVINIAKNSLEVMPTLLDKMEEDQVNEILKHEVRMNLKS